MSATAAAGATVKRTRQVPSELLPHLRRAHDHIDRNYAEPLDLDALASVAGVSKFHFVRCFEATYGDTPMRYVTRRRIERAQDLLRAGTATAGRPSATRSSLSSRSTGS